MERSPAVEALLPAWQAAEFIQPTLDCLSAQTHKDFAVCVSVDQCDDETFAICQRHAEFDKRFRVIRQERRLGYSGNCNFLLGQSKAEYVLFAFHDDILAPEYFEKLATALDAHPQAVLSYSDVDVTHADGEREHWVYTSLEGIASRVKRGDRVMMGRGLWWVPNRGLFRLAPARTIGGLKPHGAGEFAVDWPWLFRMSLLGEFVRVPETLCFKFYKPGSLSRGWRYSEEQFFEVAAARMRELWNSDLTSEEKLKLALRLSEWMVAHQPQPRRPDSPRPKSLASSKAET
jgi:glycosyltransferase involved in cell wall biosynthesis